jgi:hypothetical protein
VRRRRPPPLLAALCLACGGSLASAEERVLDVSEVLARAIDRVQLNDEERRESRYSYELVSVSETLGANGEVEETLERSYRGYPVQGVIYERLMRIDGHDLDEDQREQERKREETFLRKVADGSAHRSTGKARRANSEEPVTFDQALVSRYDVDLVGARSLEGRPCYVLSFAPKAGPLPARRRIDDILNKASGFLWVDAQSFEVVRLDFDLRKKVSFFWGLIGSVSAMTGEFERRPVDSDVWLPHKFEVYLKGRKLLQSIHRRETLSWSGYAKPDPGGAASKH